MSDPRFGMQLQELILKIKRGNVKMVRRVEKRNPFRL